MSLTLNPARHAVAAPTAATAVPLAATAALLLAQALAPAAVGGAAPWLAVAGILLGVPHGAVDHLVPFWVRGTPVTPAALAGVLAGYLAVAAAAAAALLTVPDLALAVFLVVSALHFGRGEVAFDAERDGRPVPGLAQDGTVTLAHGALVVAVPYALWHEEAAAVLVRLAPGVADAPAGARALLLATTALLAGAALLHLLRARRTTAAVELTAVGILFVAVPPAAAFGVYFGLWHALRHTDRLVRLVTPYAPASAAHPRRWAWRTCALHAAAPTAVAVAAMVALWTARGTTALAAGLAVLLALTFPHLRTVADLDRHRRLPGWPTST